MPDAVSPPDTRTSYTPKSKYAWQIYKNGNLFADLTGICQKRQFIITRNDSDQINFTVSLDKLISLASVLKINPQDIVQSWLSEARVSRYGVVLTAGELLPWNANLGGDRTINLSFRGWFELMKWRRTSDLFAGTQSQIQISQALITSTLARSYGNQGNYNGIANNASPSMDTSNTYTDQQYDEKTIYDVIEEMSQEDGGFDFEFTWNKKFNIYLPNIGTARPDIVFSYPHGNVKDIQYSVDPTKSYNYLTARGKGNAEAQISSIVEDADSENLYGLREGVLDFSNTSDQTQLDNFAAGDLAIYKNPLVLHTIIFDGSGRTSAPQVGTFGIGDQIQIAVKNFQLYSDINQFFTIDQIQVDIDDNDMETVTMAVSPTA